MKYQVSITTQIAFSKVSSEIVRIRHQKRAIKRRQVERSRRSSGAAYWHVVGTQRHAGTVSRSSGAELVRWARVWRLWVARYMSIHRSSGAVGVNTAGCNTEFFCGCIRGYNTTGYNTESLCGCIRTYTLQNISVCDLLYPIVARLRTLQRSTY